MDPLSALGAAGSAVGFTSLGIQVCQGLLGYYGSFKDARVDIRRLSSSVERLDGSLKQPAKALSSKTTTLDHGMAAEAKQNMEVLEIGAWEELKTAGRRALYPFRESTVIKLKEIVDDSLSHLYLILSALQLHTQLGSSQCVEDIGVRLAKLQLDNRTQSIHKWLDPPDPSINYNAAREKRQKNTGKWLLDSSAYNAWKTSPCSRLWLYGKPGCGKTVLSSTVIEEIQATCQYTTDTALLYFYFRHDAKSTKGCDNQYSQMLRSLLVQLSFQSPSLPEALDDLFEKSFNGERQPGDSDLALVIRDLLRKFENAFIVLDALDESDETRHLFRFFGRLFETPINGLHFLVTSRRYVIITETLSSYDQINVEEEAVAKDISLFVKEQLADSEYDGLPQDLKLEIETKLTRDADGMFQWVVCQLSTLRSCRNASIEKIRKTLASLPETLDATYERMLSAVGEDDIEDVLKILEWVAFAKRPLALEELGEAVAVDLNASPLPQYAVDRKPLNSQYILEICADLFHVRYFNVEVWGGPTGEKEVTNTLHRSEVRFSHFSVREYLCSKQLRNAKGIISKYSLQARAAHINIGESCLAYALYWKDKREEAESTWNEYARLWVAFDRFSIAPLYDYAVAYFPDHCRAAEEERSIVPLAMQWYMRRSSDPLVKAAEQGMPRTVSSILSIEGVEINSRNRKLQWDVGAHEATALYYGSMNGHADVVEILVRNGVDYKIECIPGHNALHAAVMGGHVAVVKILLSLGTSDPVGSMSFPLLQGEAAQSALRYAFGYRQYEIARFIVDNSDFLKAQVLDKNIGINSFIRDCLLWLSNAESQSVG